MTTTDTAPAMQGQPDTIAEGIANLEHHERDPGEQMPPIINEEVARAFVDMAER